MNTSAKSPLHTAPPTSSALDEETARAELYGLLALLYYAPPEPELLAQLRVAVTETNSSGAILSDIVLAPWLVTYGSPDILDAT